MAKAEDLSMECSPTPQQRSERSEEGREGRGHRRLSLTRSAKNINDFEADEICGRDSRRPAGPWNGTCLRREWHAACARVGVKAKLYEGTKHSRATDLLRQKIDERTLQVLLGHRDAKSTRRYARLANQALVEAIRPTHKKVKNLSSAPPAELEV